MNTTTTRLTWYVAADEVRREESRRRDVLMAEYRAEGYGAEAAYLLAQVELDQGFGDVPFQGERRYLGEEIQARRRRDRMEERGI